MGVGLVVAPGFASGTLGVARARAGVAAAMVTVTQQVGGAVGTALFSTIAVSATDNYIKGPPTQQTLAAAQVHGYTTVFLIAAVMIGVGAVLTGFFLRGIGAPRRGDAAEPAMAH
jgi:hypothetical protein